MQLQTVIDTKQLCFVQWHKSASLLVTSFLSQVIIKTLNIQILIGAASDTAVKFDIFSLIIRERKIILKSVCVPLALVFMVFYPTVILYKQILNLYAEENAIEDTIFYLGEALRRGVIELEVFLKVPTSSCMTEITFTHCTVVLCGVCLIDSYSPLLQHVRLLSRKQFQLRALMQKARKTAGLSDLY